MIINTLERTLLVKLTKIHTDKQLIGHVFRLGEPSKIVVTKDLYDILGGWKDIGEMIGHGIHCPVVKTKGMVLQISYGGTEIFPKEEDFIPDFYICKTRWPFKIEVLWGIEYFKSRRSFSYYQVIYNQRGPRKLLRMADLVRRV